MFGASVCEPGVEGLLCPGETCAESNDCFSRCCAVLGSICEDHTPDSTCIGDGIIQTWGIFLLIILILMLLVSGLFFYKRCQKKDSEVVQQDVPFLSENLEDQTIEQS